MIHHTLANRGVTPEEVIFPLSATMLNHLHEYDACLESFSTAIKPLIDFVSNDDASIDVLNETLNLFLKLCWQGKGSVSKAKRKSHFSMFEEHELDAMERLAAPYFAVQSGEEALNKNIHKRLFNN